MKKVQRVAVQVENKLKRTNKKEERKTMSQQLMKGVDANMKKCWVKYNPALGKIWTNPASDLSVSPSPQTQTSQWQSSISCTGAELGHL